jgi:hypothetical protein
MQLGAITDCVRCTSSLRSLLGSDMGLRGDLGIFFLGGLLHLGVPAHPWLMYALVYVPVRYLEWSIMAMLLGSKGGEVHRVGDAATQRWIVEGIVVSHLAGLLLVLLYGGSGSLLPVGRFLC